MGKEGKQSAPVLWYLWVEACLQTLGSPYNSYTYSDQLAVSEAMSTGKAFGPGLIPEITGQAVIVQNVFDPALVQSGLVEGCELISIDGEPLTEENGYQFDKWMRQDTFPYRISFRADSEEKTVKAEAVPFRYPTLTWARWRDIGYLRLSRFSRDSLVELRRLFRRLRKDPPAGLVIDLRGNPGGMANFALVDCFFKPGQIIGTYQPMSESEPQTIEASIEYYDYPIALLVNGDSASMSEVFAAAVQTNHRGVVIGEKTFGKGVGQNCQLIGGEGRLCLVEDTFYYPGTDKTWNEEGILPDHVIEAPEERREEIDKFLWSAGLDLSAQRKIDKALDKAFRVLGENDK
jgi:carboxyl-terminal processing protease